MRMNRTNSIGKLFLAILFSVICANCSAFVPVDSDRNFKQSISGKWRFLFNKDRAGFEKKHYDDSDWPMIETPSNWELSGFEEPKYAKPRKGTALYRKTFNLPQDWKDRNLLIRFEAVAFGFEFWINGKYAGEFNSAFNRSEFDITDLVEFDSANVIALKIDRRRKGWDFDSHDSWGLSGIFRDVLLFSVPKNHFKNISISTDLNNDCSKAQININLELSNVFPNKESFNLTAELYNPENDLLKKTSLIESDQKKVNKIKFEINDPRLWNAETPNLYTLKLILKNSDGSVHRIEKKVGIRQVRIKNAVFTLNNAPVKLRGVNHHDIHYQVGRALTKKHYLQDIMLMKSANINTVRTSHYPPSPLFIELCDKFGLYVICEVPFGKGEHHLLEDDYLENLYQRAYSTVMRDRNNPSVIIWSVGNENPVVPNVIKTAEYVKSLDSTRPLLLPGAGESGGTWDIPLPDTIDIIAPHYPYAYPTEGRGRWNLLEAANTDKVNRPIICTEFNHSLGNAFEGLAKRWEVIEKYDRLAGGCIWHFQDQGIKRKITGKLRVLDNDIQRLDADDFKEPPVISPDLWLDDDTVIDSCGASGSDGIVYGDRVKQVDYWITKKVYSPVHIPIDKVKINTTEPTIEIPIHNRYDFTNLNKVTCNWQLLSEGTVCDEGSLKTDLAPHEKGIIKIDTKLPETSDRISWLELTFLDSKENLIVQRSIRLVQDNNFLESKKSFLTFSDTGNGTMSENLNIKLDIETTPWTIYNLQQPEISVKGPFIDIGRKPELAELKRMSPAQRAINDKMFLTSPEIIETNIQNNNTEFHFKLRYMIDDSLQKYVTLEGNLKITSDEFLDLNYKISVHNIKEDLLEIGLAFSLEEDFNELFWLGNGPYNSYPGQRKAAEFGVWNIKPHEKYNPKNRYYKGNREFVELAIVSNKNQNSVGFIFDSATISLQKFQDKMWFSHILRSAGKGNKPGGMSTLYPAEITDAEPLKGQFRFKILQNVKSSNKFNFINNTKGI